MLLRAQGGIVQTVTSPRSMHSSEQRNVMENDAETKRWYPTDRYEPRAREDARYGYAGNATVTDSYSSASVE